MPNAERYRKGKIKQLVVEAIKQAPKGRNEMDSKTLDALADLLHVPEAEDGRGINLLVLEEMLIQTHDLGYINGGVNHLSALMKE